ncbi:MAG: Fic family protein [Helicobacteraceae bacterium]|nr:Fic family protein [Helicobacteraceae bacterium]
MAIVEYELSASRAFDLFKNPIRGNFDLKHLKAIHKHLFQDIYAWAGELRTVNISKEDSLFANPAYIESEMKTIHQKLKRDDLLRNLSKSNFVSKFAELFGDINALHPFREGNGRTIREYMRQLAKTAGYVFDQTKICENKEKWNYASERSMFGDMTEIKTLFNDTISPQKNIKIERDCDMGFGR